jgi:hypothetical protein
MRTGAKVFLVLAILGVLAYGLLGPVLVSSHLHDRANTAAHAGYTQMISTSSSTASVDKAVAASVGHQSNIEVKSVSVKNGEVTVVLQEKVHSFMSGVPGLKNWFIVTASETSSAFG